MQEREKFVSTQADRSEAIRIAEEIIEEQYFVSSREERNRAVKAATEITRPFLTQILIRMLENSIRQETEGVTAETLFNPNKKNTDPLLLYKDKNNHPFGEKF